MERYNIYAGLGGSFGGADYVYTAEFESLDEADSIVYEIAVEEYQSYEGLHGIRDWNDCFSDFCEKEGIPETNDNEAKYEDTINEIYQEEIDNWIEYYAVLTSEDSNLSESELDIR